MYTYIKVYIYYVYIGIYTYSYVYMYTWIPDGPMMAARWPHAGCKMAQNDGCKMAQDKPHMMTAISSLVARDDPHDDCT